MIIKSIRWHIQLWHGILLLFVVSSLLTWVYFIEKDIVKKNIELELAATTNSILPRLLGNPDAPAANRFPDPSNPEARPENRAKSNERTERGERRRPGGRGSQRPGMRPNGEGRRPNGPNKPGKFQRPREGGAEPGQVPRQRRVNPEIAREYEAEGYYFIIQAPNGNIVYSSDSAPSPPAMERISAEMTDGAVWRNGNLEYLHYTPSNRRIITGLNANIVKSRSEPMMPRLIVFGIIVLIVGIAGGWIMSGRSLRPMRRITDTAVSISKGDTERRINVGQTESELGQLAQTLNESFDKLSSLAKRQARFTADASHDLRTPISIIQAKCQLALAKDRDSASYRDTIQNCLTATEHMADLVESLIELARHDAGSMKLHKEFTDVSQVINDCITMHAPLVEDKPIELVTNTVETDSLIDPTRLKQVLINLISNAIHHTKSGNITVSCRPVNDMVEINVQDTGSGIAEADLPYIFERFYKADQSRHKVEKSHGLGLSITRSIVEAHNGTISVTSTEGEGTTFTILFPGMKEQP